MCWLSVRAVTDSSASVDTAEQLKRHDFGSFAAVGKAEKNMDFFGDFWWGCMWIGEGAGLIG